MIYRQAALALFVAGAWSFAATMATAATIQTTGLRGHFDADVGVDYDDDEESSTFGYVTSWTNQGSGTDATLTLGTTTFTGDAIGYQEDQRNGKGVVSFNLDMSSNTSNAYTRLAFSSGTDTNGLENGYAIFTVVRFASLSSNSFYRILRTANDANSFFTRATGTYLELKAWSSPPGEASDRARFDYFDDEYGYEGEEFAILTGIVTPEEHKLYLNGVLVATSDLAPTSQSTQNDWWIGYTTIGDIGSVLLYDNTPTLAQLNQSGAALAEMYDLSWGNAIPEPATGWLAVLAGLVLCRSRRGARKG